MRIGRYTLERRLGAGGYGEVWRGWLEGEAGFRKPVAVKLLLRPSGPVGDDGERDPDTSASFVNEALIGARLKHPNIVDVYEFTRIDGQYLLAMELIDGATVERLLAAAPEGLAPDRAVDLVRQTAAGLAYAHELGDQDGQPLHIVHRDLKPGNLMVDANGVLKILDFGIGVFRLSRRTTMPGIAKGTLAYMAPELFRGAGVTNAVDRWALGAIAYELATGQPLVPDGELHATVAAIVGVEPGAVGRVVAARVPALGPIVTGLLARDPNERMTAAEVLARLSTPSGGWSYAPPPGLGATSGGSRAEVTIAVDSHEVAPALAPSTTVPVVAPGGGAKRPWWVAGGAAAAVLALVALGAWWSGSGAPVGPAEGGTVRIGTPRTRGTLDPYARTTTMGLEVLGQVLEPLVGLDDDGQPVPRAVAAWRVEGRATTLTLRDDLWFHPHPCLAPEGRAANAEDLRSSVERALHRDFVWSPIAERDTPHPRIQVVDGRSVRLELDRDFPFVVQDLADVVLLPADLDRCEQERSLVQPIGTGPFRFAGPALGENLEVVRNERWWGRDASGRALPYVDGLVAKYVPDPHEALLALSTGELDVFQANNGDWLAPWATGKQEAPPDVRIAVHSDAGRLGIKGLLFLRDREAPIPEPVRRAVNAALDRDAIGAVPDAREFVAGARFLPPDRLGHDPGLVPAGADPEAARRILAENPPWTSEIVIGAFKSDLGVGEEIRAQLAAVGLSVRVVEFTQQSLEATMRKPQVDAVIVEIYARTWGVDPYPFLSDLTSSVGEVTWLSQPVKDTMDRAAHEPNRAAREVLYADIERGLLADVGYLPLGFLKTESTWSTWALGPRVEGLVQSETGKLAIDDATPAYAGVSLTPEAR